LRRAVELGEIVPYYQPVVALASGEIAGFEALARWNHPKRGVVGPVDFIPLAEETGLIAPLGMSILRQACEQLGRWDREFPAGQPLSMSVNVSARQFRQLDLAEEIRWSLAAAGIAPERLRLEITESALMDDAAGAVETLRQLKAIGVRLAIDDFGTGYSSLSYLHRFPIDALKVDRSFVTRMSTDRESRGIVKTIITLGDELNMDVVAEGVETAEHSAALAGLACEYGQGYFFSRPLDADGAATLLRDGARWADGGTQTSPRVDSDQSDAAYTM
jgi:EAL domain-containing protein (putative c-di-GMP-specific phosphodiesterase class I)